jgi:hypothetical protein
MTVTPILQIAEVASNQNQKEVTINDGFLGVENATQAPLTVSLSAGNTATLSAGQFVGSFAFVCSGQSANATLVVPLSKRFFLVRNLDATHQVTVGGATGATVIVAGNTSVLIFCDATNCSDCGSGSVVAGSVTSLSAGTGIALSASTGPVTVSLANIANNDFLANTSGGSAPPIPTTLSTYLDSVLGASTGMVVYRGGGGWTTFNLDVAIQGIAVKPSATVATAAALPSNTYSNGTSGVGATLTATANGALTVDGVAVAVSNNILVKNEVTTANNGLYVVTQTGNGSNPYILTRHIDMDQTGEFLGAMVAVEEFGSANQNSLWLCTPAVTVTVGTTAVPFTQLNSSTSYTAGTGITISAGVVSLSVIANNTVLGNVSGGSAAPGPITQTQLTALINTFTTSLPGSAPASGGGSINYLRADGTWTSPPGGTTMGINTQTGTTYTLVLGDAGQVIEMDNASANTLTVPPNSSVAFPTGTVLNVRQKGAGQTTIAAGAGVTINTPETLLIRKQYGLATLHKRGTDDWCIEGNLQVAP